MSIVATLLDKARTRKGITSDNALAQHLGTNRQVVSQWRHGDSYPSEDNIAELAEMAGDDPVQWLVAVKAVRAEGKAGKAWSALAKRLAAVTAGLGVVALAYFHGFDAVVIEALAPLAVTSHAIHYAKCRGSDESGRTAPTPLDLAMDLFTAENLGEVGCPPLFGVPSVNIMPSKRRKVCTCPVGVRNVCIDPAMPPRSCCCTRRSLPSTHANCTHLTRMIAAAELPHLLPALAPILLGVQQLAP